MDHYDPWNPEHIRERDPEDVIREISARLIQGQARARERTYNFLRSNRGYIVSAVIFFLLSMRLVAVAHGDPVTAVGLITVAGPLQTLLPFFLEAFSTLTPATLYWVVMLTFFPNKPPWLQSRVNVVALIFAAAIPGIFLAPWWLMLIVSVLSLTHLWSIPAQAKANARTVRESIEGDPSAQNRLRSLRPQRGIAIGFLMVAALLLVPAGLSDTPWLPPQRVKTPDGVMVAYGVAIDVEGATFLRDEDRTLVILDEDELLEREFCTKRSSERSIAMLLRPGSNYPQCFD